MPDSIPDNSLPSDASHTHQASRPRKLHRYPSYSKRHASFNSPREVPLPSPTLWESDAPNPFLAIATDQLLPSSSKSQQVFEPSPSSPTAWSNRFHSQEGSGPQPMASSSRPQSPISPTHHTSSHDDLNPTWRLRHHHSQHMSSGSGSAASVSPPHSPVSTAPNGEIVLSAPRTPSSSNDQGDNPSKENQTAPPPAQGPDSPPIYLSCRPFSLPETQSSSYSSTLPSYLRPSSPSASPSMPDRSPAWIDRFSSASLPPPSQIPFYALPKINSNPSNMASTDLDPRAPSSLSQAAWSGSATPESSSDRSGLRCPPLHNESSSSSSSGGSGSTTSSSPNTESSFHIHAPNKSSPFPHVPRPQSASDGSPAPRAASANPAAPPARALSPAPSRSPPPPFRAAQPLPPPPPIAEHTAIQPYVSLREPSAYPPPEPPVILPAEPLATETNHASARATAPYIPFLSHGPPPPDSWIEVETTASEYRLHVRLPGFSREGITLATKRRRILHVVADRWDNGGGHFERRISFGYDADLVQVRAEFDGVMLRITIPRRASPVMVTSSGRPGPIGRM